MDSLTKLNLDNYKPLRDVVFENLRSAILEGKLKSGQRLMEVQLAEQLGVSRTPVREAIRKLELEGLVVMLPRKGAYVANINTQPTYCTAGIPYTFRVRTTCSAFW